MSRLPLLNATDGSGGVPGLQIPQGQAGNVIHLCVCSLYLSWGEGRDQKAKEMRCNSCLMA